MSREFRSISDCHAAIEAHRATRPARETVGGPVLEIGDRRAEGHEGVRGWIGGMSHRDVHCWRVSHPGGHFYQHKTGHRGIFAVVIDVPTYVCVEQHPLFDAWRATYFAFVDGVPAMLEAREACERAWYTRMWDLWEQFNSFPGRNRAVWSRAMAEYGPEWAGVHEAACRLASEARTHMKGEQHGREVQGD